MDVSADAPVDKTAQMRAAQADLLPWVEKYRPKDMSELVSHDEIISTITRLIDAGKLPHLLLYGPPGTGKTSTILACARRMYGKRFASMVLELNASDDRGIDVVREQIKEFASTRQMWTSMPKLIVLDEADNMTSPAQMALRRVIEKYVSNVRFCLICNYASKIMPALQSRTTRFRFAPLTDEQAIGRTQHVAEAEGVRAAGGGVEACVALGRGDMRRCLNLLQSTHMSFGLVSEENVYRCAGQPTPADTDAIFRSLMEEDFSTALSSVWSRLQDRGVALQDVLTELHHLVLALEAKPLPKASLVASLADAEERLSVGTSERLQLAGLVGLFQLARPHLGVAG